MNTPIRCIVADDHPAVLAAVSDHIGFADDLQLVGVAADGATALVLIGREGPDIAILDVQMPRLGGIEVTRQLVAEASATATILYTGFPERELLLDALDAGARGFVLKEAPINDLLRAIRTVAGGDSYIDPTLAPVLAGPAAAGRLPALTAREREVLELLAQGERNDDVARHLSLSPHTVQSHVRNAMTKLAADTRTQAVATAFRQSLID